MPYWCSSNVMTAAGAATPDQAYLGMLTCLQPLDWQVFEARFPASGGWQGACVQAGDATPGIASLLQQAFWSRLAGGV